MVLLHILDSVESLLRGPQGPLAACLPPLKKQAAFFSSPHLHYR
jgi:hypothetical protein